jgi:hypothetical protein
MKTLPLIALLNLLLMAGQCSNEPCEIQYTVVESQISFFVVDRNGYTLLPDPRQLFLYPKAYHIDSVQFLNEEGQPLPPHQYFKDYMGPVTGHYIGAYLFDNTAQPKPDYYAAGAVTFLVRLSATDTDTVRVVYDYDPLECGYRSNQFEVYLNGQPMPKSDKDGFLGQHIITK